MSDPLGTKINNYANEYEFRGDTDYTPTDAERTMIEDAINGFLADYPETGRIDRFDQIMSELEKRFPAPRRTDRLPEAHYVESIDRLLAWKKEVEAVKAPSS